MTQVLKHMTAFASAMVVGKIKKATYYLAPNIVTKITHHGAGRERSLQQTFSFTIGRPNYAERRFIKTCRKAGEPFPIKKVQFKHRPAKAKRK